MKGNKLTEPTPEEVRQALHGRRISYVHFPPDKSGLRSGVRECDTVQIHMSATYHGDHDEHWIVVSDVVDGQLCERTRINPRYVESWDWHESDLPTTKF